MLTSRPERGSDADRVEFLDQFRGFAVSLMILVNILGIFEPKPFDQIPDEDWRRFFEVNVLSGARLSPESF